VLAKHFILHLYDPVFYPHKSTLPPIAEQTAIFTVQMRLQDQPVQTDFQRKFVIARRFTRR
jgi:hypothetical protein